MESISTTIVIGIVTGLVTASILLILKSLFFNSFLPWYRQFMYRGVNLSGSWHRCTNVQKTLLELNQVCETITGKATIQMFDELPKEIRPELHIDDIRTFDVTGFVAERFVSLTFWNTDKTRLGLSIYLLQVDGDGTMLSGQTCRYAPMVSEIRSGPATFYRDSARMMREFDKVRMLRKEHLDVQPKNECPLAEDGNA